MKTQSHASFLVRAWHKIVYSSVPAHDPLLFLSMTMFNFSGGWDRLLQKRRQF